MEWFKEYQLPLTDTFIDFKKAFDSKTGVLYNNFKSNVMVDGSISDLHPIYWSATG